MAVLSRRPEWPTTASIFQCFYVQVSSKNLIVVEKLLLLNLYFVPESNTKKRAWAGWWGSLIADAALLSLVQMLSMVGKTVPVMDRAESTTLCRILHSC